jgi:hypothetical protein
MRAGKSVSVSSADTRRLKALVQDRNTPQKHPWRAQIGLLKAEGFGTNAIMRETGESKTCVWRWQERFAAEGVDGLLRDKTRPSRIPKLDPAIAEREVALIMESFERSESRTRTRITNLSKSTQKMRRRKPSTPSGPSKV